MYLPAAIQHVTIHKKNQWEFSTLQVAIIKLKPVWCQFLCATPMCGLILKHESKEKFLLKSLY